MGKGLTVLLRLPQLNHRCGAPTRSVPCGKEKRMKLGHITAAVAASFLMAGAASAADLPRKSAPQAFVQPLPIFTWTGFYVGINGGYVFDGGRSSLTGSTGLLATGLAPAGNVKTLGEGFTIGGTVGYNYQIGNIVAGLEADLNYVDLGKTVSTSIGGLTTTFSQQATYLGTVRGRLGVAFDRVLIYATGGLAYGDQDASTNLGGLGALWSGGKSTTRFGYTVGAGLEYAITNNWSAKVEYLYYDLGKADYTSPQIAGAVIPGVFGTTRAENKGNLVRAGINYRF
jgi:outer membrane immunogenic protein